MIAQIHRGEAVIPRTFNEGVQSGNLTIGNNKDIIVAINNLSSRMDNFVKSANKSATILEEAQYGQRTLKVEVISA